MKSLYHQLADLDEKLPGHSLFRIMLFIYVAENGAIREAETQYYLAMDRRQFINSAKILQDSGLVRRERRLVPREGKSITTSYKKKYSPNKYIWHLVLTDYGEEVYYDAMCENPPEPVSYNIKGFPRNLNGNELRA